MNNISTIELESRIEGRKREIGQRIALERNALGLSQDELKEIIHIGTRQTIWKWETGKNLPTMRDFLELCELFNCELAYLLCEQDCKTKENTDIQKATGLSEVAIENIRKLNKPHYRRLFDTGKNEPRSITFNRLVENDSFLALLDSIYELVQPTRYYKDESGETHSTDEYYDFNIFNLQQRFIDIIKDMRTDTKR